MPMQSLCYDAMQYKCHSTLPEFLLHSCLAAVPSVLHAQKQMSWCMQGEIQKAFMDFQSGKLQNPTDDVWA